MTTILLVILGVLLAAASVLFVVYYGGDAFGGGKTEAEAGRLVSEGAQMEAALELFYRQEGHYPTSDDPVAELMTAGYLSHEPLGTRTSMPDRWKIDYDAGMIRAQLGLTDEEETMDICLKARQQLELPDTGTELGVYKCDGTDSPGGVLPGREPCCIGEVGVGGGPAVEVTPAFQPDLCGAAPAASASYADKGAWLACYAKQVNTAAEFWITSGRGQTPTLSALLAEEYIHHPAPSYPEISYIGVTNFASNYVPFASSAPSNDKPVYFWITFNGGTLNQGESFSTATANASGGYLTKAGGAFWHVYSQPIYWPHEYDDRVVVDPELTWEGPIPSATASNAQRAEYMGYWFLKNSAAIKQWKADGKPGSQITSISGLYATNYDTAPPPPLKDGEGLGITTSTAYDNNGVPALIWYSYYRNSGASSLCSAISNRVYGQLKCGSYSTNYYGAAKTHR